MPQRLLRLAVVFWVGSLFTVGFLVAPTLFSALDVTHAGDVAARLFRSEAIVCLVCGIVALALANRLVRGDRDGYRRLRWLIFLMLLCTLLGYFAIEPFLNMWRLAASQAGVDVAHSTYASRFALMHSVATGFYLLQSLLGLVLAWRLPVSVRSWY